MRIVRPILITIAFLIAVAIIVLTLIYYARDTEKRELTDDDRKGTGGQYIKLSGGITHYQLAGPDTGKVVILVHGFSVPYFIWDGTYEYLANNGFKVVRYDMYGRGFSDRPDAVYDKALYQTQLLDLIRELHLKKPVSLMGISFGGAVVTDFIAAYSAIVKKVVVIDPAYPSEVPAASKFYTNYYEATHGEERANGQLSDFKYPERHPDWVKKYRVQMQYKGFRNALISTMYNYRYKGRKANTRLSNTHKPVLLIWGMEDHTVPFKYSDSVLSVLKPEFMPVADAGHLPFIEQADKVNARILAFLKK